LPQVWLGGVIAHFADDDSGSTSKLTGSTCPATTVANAVPSVVTFSVHAATSSSNGTGGIIRNNGYILTNDHVISSAVPGGTIDALFTSGQTERATVVGRVITLDLAVVNVEVSKPLPTIALGHSDAVQVGQPVVALGAPLGLSGTVTSGIISALGRDVPLPAAGGKTARLPGALQTDASINPGNSGGPLVDCGGRMIGVNTAIATVPNSAGQSGGGSVGIGFAIPVDLASVVADQLISNGRFSPPYLGMSTVPIPASAAHQFGVDAGLFVQDVSANGPAAKAGLQTGDVITHINHKKTSGPDDLVIATLRMNPGDKVSIDYVRDGKSMTTTLTLEAQP
jgi:putative serine protease PepD